MTIDIKSIYLLIILHAPETGCASPDRTSHSACGRAPLADRQRRVSWLRNRQACRGSSRAEIANGLRHSLPRPVPARNDGTARESLGRSAACGRRESARPAVICAHWPRRGGRAGSESRRRVLAKSQTLETSIAPGVRVRARLPQSLNFWLRRSCAATAINPTPRRPSVAGSGTGAGADESTNCVTRPQPSKLAPKLWARLNKPFAFPLSEAKWAALSRASLDAPPGMTMSSSRLPRLGL